MVTNQLLRDIKELLETIYANVKSNFKVTKL